MNMQVTDWVGHYKAVRSRIANAAPVPARIRLGRELYAHPIGPMFIVMKSVEATAPVVEDKRDWLIIRPTPNHTRRIIREVADLYGVTPEAIVGPSREAKFTRPRHHVVYRLRTELQLSLPEIGRRLGGRDHTSALNSYRRFKSLIEKGEVSL